MEKKRTITEESKALADSIVSNDHDALAARLSGRQPTIEIAGHTFFVDLHWNLLRPKDDFFTPGISFSDIDYCFNDEAGKYQFPYNPLTHQACDLDSSLLTELPKDLILAEIPPEKVLDPVGYAKIHGLDLEQTLKEHPVREHFQARIIPWKETPIVDIVKDNLRKINKDNNQQRDSDQEKPKRKQGRRM